jgi:hypothetical protein
VGVTAELSAFLNDYFHGSPQSPDKRYESSIK